MKLESMKAAGSENKAAISARKVIAEAHVMAQAKIVKMAAARRGVWRRGAVAARQKRRRRRKRGSVIGGARRGAGVAWRSINNRLAARPPSRGVASAAKSG